MTAGSRIWKEWLPAAALSLVLNALMFGALPGLLDRQNSISIERVPLEPVNFVRLKQETPPIRRKPPPEKKQSHRAKKLKPKMTQPQKSPELTIPFKPNRFQPVTPGALTVPLARGVDLGTNPFKGQWGVGDLDQPLAPLVRIPPIYPARAKRQGIEGWVRVKFLVRGSGEVARVEILESVPEKLFDNSVRRCVSGWRFKPGTVEGEPVDVWAETVIRFKLE
jgi:protein TonB